MPKEQLVFQQLSIRRLPGMSHGVQTYADFSPHINLIIGPNGAGKTSTAKTMLDLIWKKGSDETVAHGMVTLGGREWELTVDSRRAASTSNGLADALPGIPSLEGQKRYFLAAHDLVAAVDDDLARLVVTASTGYDLATADRTLRYGLGGITTNTGLYREYNGARKAYDELLASQEALNRHRGKLGELLLEKQEAERAGLMLQWDAKLLELLRARESLAEAKGQIETMPGVIAQLSGEEFNELTALTRQITDFGKRIDDKNGIISAAEGRIISLNLPETGLREGLLAELEGKISQLAGLEREILGDERTVAEAVSLEEAALKKLGWEPGDEDWEGVSWGDLDELDKALQQYHQHLSRKGAIEALVKAFDESRPVDNPAGAENLLLGIRALTAWLKEIREKGRKEAPLWSIWLLSGLAVLTVSAVMMLGKIGVVGVLLIIGAAILVYVAASRPRNASAGPDRRKEFELLGLDTFSDWTEAAVSDRLTELAGQLNAARWQQTVTSQVKVYRNELTVEQNELNKLLLLYDGLRAKLALVPGIPVDDIRSYDGMYWFVHNGVAWCERHAERLGFQTVQTKRVEQSRNLLREVNDLFAEALAGPVNDSVAATALRQRLDTARDVWRDAKTVIANARKDIEETLGQLQTVKDTAAELYAKVQVDAGSDEQVREICSKVVGYRLAVAQLERMAAVAEAYQTEVRTSPLFSTMGSEVESIQRPQVEERMKDLEIQAEKYDSISTEIESIRADIRLAEGGSTLEAALKQVDDSVADLEIEYDNRLAAATGRLLTNALKKQSDERDRPPVFRSADAMLSRITLGRYRLRLRDGDQPTFGAWDTVESQWKELRQLSSGTRIQLLLCVRLAFLEAQEETVSLPIMADELMSSSDPLRTRATMETLTEICREGRQIFYFAPQEDIVARWSAFLADKSDLSMKVFALTRQQNEAYGADLMPPTPNIAGAHLLGEVPLVDDLDHAAYGARLTPGRFDPMIDSPERLHIWYLFDDPHIVHALLKKGLNHWSQVASYVGASGTIEGLDTATMEDARAKASVLERFLELYRQGRNYPIDRSVLVKSGAVSDQYLDPMVEILERNGGDPVRLMDALEAGGVFRLSTKRKELLKAYLIDEGYISTDNRIDDQDIWVLLLAFISQTCISDESARGFIARVLGA